MSEAPALCLIGGWGSTEAVWRGMLDHVEMRGGHVHFVSWLECIRDWPGVLARLRAQARRCVLVGWSLGSLFALRAAVEAESDAENSQRPASKIAALVLVAATARMCSAEGYSGADARMLAAMRVRMKRTPEAVLEEFASACAAPDGGDAVRLSWLRQARQFSAEELAAGLDSLATLDLRERLEEIGSQCRILHGDCDRIVPLASAQFLAGRIRGAELQVLAGRGHALPFTAAEEIARTVASVLR
jgi:pimeloyl-ACP methyl ester carboxylesterase